MSKRSLWAALREMTPSALMIGVTEPFMIPYALALGAGALQAGFLAAARNLLLSLVQLKSADAVHRIGHRKPLVMFTGAAQAFLFLPLAFAAPLFGVHAVTAVIVLYSLASALAAFGGPAWGSMVSEYLQAEERGTFFGRLGRISAFWLTVAGLAGGALLHFFSDRPLVGFGLLCLMAFAFRLRSLYWLSLFEEGPVREQPEERLKFRKFLFAFREDNFVRFAFSFGLFNFAVHMAAPFLAVYMLQDLGFSYFDYSVVIFSGTLVGMLAVQPWGKAGDTVGNQAVLRSTVLLDSLLPAFWAVCRWPPGILMLQMAGAFLWAGLNLSAVNFVYDSAKPALRTRYLSYFNALNGCCVSAGILLGGYLAERLPPLNESRFVTLLCLSAALRCVTALAFRRLVREVRVVHQVGLREVVFDLTHQQVTQVLGYLSRDNQKVPR